MFGPQLATNKEPKHLSDKLDFPIFIIPNSNGKRFSRGLKNFRIFKSNRHWSAIKDRHESVYSASSQVQKKLRFLQNWNHGRKFLKIFKRQKSSFLTQNLIFSQSTCGKQRPRHKRNEREGDHLQADLSVREIPRWQKSNNEFKILRR